MSSFSDILDRRPDEIERPKPLPQGTYRAIVKGMYEEVISSQKKTPGVKFQFQIVSAGDDVDQEALNEWSQRKDGSTRVLSDATLSTTFWVTEGAAFMLTDFLTNLGLLDEDGKREDGASMRAVLSETPNCEVMLFIKHRVSEDGKMTFAEVGSTAKVED